MKRPKISIVITTWLASSKDYLDLLIRSISNLSYPKDCIDVILVGRPGYMPKYPGVLTVSPDKEKFYCTEGVNYGVSLASQDSHYLLLLNDDTCLTRDCLSILVENSQAAGDTFISSPICNTDSNAIHTLIFKTADGEMMLKGMMRLSDVKDEQALMDAQSCYSSGVFYGTHICMSSVLIPRSIWRAVGTFDENFRGGPDDIDYSLRTLKAGFRLGYVLNAVIWHFGHVTIDHTVSPETWLYNTKYFHSKWGQLPTQVTEGYVKRVEAMLASGSVTEEMRKDHT